ncbi:hypothetical protein CERZMDRAFT_102040 [Cercospora zeae-maydis SCOH1-5]|uniref:F-box domain-containing protein n=1 Tax=Cercospora zeae-maydis SCOH1-5 TaxID=717836 RepID=A0A6A6F1G3_9PEZI|nr:hypothetical protein CERZMDRAFT_102040 [Cercospora zeae-maydis SCOH1-5]
MAAAADRALHVPELLERILLSLPMKDLLLDQRVSKYWKALIKNSPKLQQALFYRPDYGTETWIAVDFEGLEYIGVEYSIIEAISVQDKQTASKDDWHQKVVIGRFNDLLLNWCGHSTVGIADQGLNDFAIPAHPRSDIDSDAGDSGSDQDEDEGTEYPSSERFIEPIRPLHQSFKPSWCDMYLSQPPSTHIEFPNRFGDDCNFANGKWGECKNEKGITAGELLETMGAVHGGINFDALVDMRVGYIVNILDPDTAGKKPLLLDEGIRRFKKLEELTGSKANVMATCKRIGDNLEVMRSDKDFAKVVKYGLLDVITEDTDVENLLMEKEHLPDCKIIDCDGCSGLFHAFDKNQEDGKDEK